MERAVAGADWGEVEAAMRAFEGEVARMEAHIAGLAA
jgi:hypothetical protein